MTWRPVLEQRDVDTARAMIAEISEALSTTRSSTPDLARGDAGVALFYHYLAIVTEDESAALRAADLVMAAVARASTLSCSLFSGFTGLGWSLEHITDTSEEDANENIDRALAFVLDVAEWERDFDLLYGLAGMALYALERLPRPSAAAALETIVCHLDAICDRHNGTVAWLTKAHLLPSETAAIAPSGMYIVGVAHGIPAIINVLARILGSGIAVERARDLFDGAVRWLLLHRGSNTSSVYPYWIANGSPAPAEFRLAWCYGDLGIAATLFSAARHANEPALESAALALAREAANRPAGTCGVVDAALCHGSFGLAHMFARLHNATRAPWLRDAAIRWYRDGFSRYRRGESFGGFPAWDVPTQAYVADAGLLSGAAGIGLALLAAVSEIEPAWDRLLLIDV